MSRAQDMARFWDARAREDAYWFVDNRLEYGAPDVERFWTEGVVDLDGLLSSVDASLRADDRVLEIGCGLGRLTRPLAARVASVKALDVSEEMLARARSLNPELSNVEWIRGSGVDLSSIDQGSIDACLSHVVFQHIPDVEIILGYVREIGRVLRSGGWAVFQVSNDPDVHRQRGLRSQLRSRVSRGPKGTNSAEWLGSSVELKDLRNAAREGGLAIERVAGEGTQYCIVRARRS